MAQAQGSSVSLRAGFETSYGVTGSSNFEMPFAPTLDLKETQNLNDSSVIRGTRNMDKAFLGFKSVDGSLTVPVDDNACGKWLKGFFGTPTTTDNGGTYTHTFKVNDTAIPSMFIEVAHTDINQYYLYNGIKLNNFDISFGGDGELLMNIGLMGQKVTQSGTQVLAPSSIVSEKFGQFQASITGASNVKDISLNYTNNLDGNSYVIGDGGTRGDIPLGMAGVSGSFTALFENDTLLADARNNVDKDFNITLTNGTSVLSFDMNEVTLEPTGVTIDSPQGLTQTFNFTAFWATHGDGSALVTKLTNTTATV